MQKIHLFFLKTSFLVLFSIILSIKILWSSVLLRFSKLTGINSGTQNDIIFESVEVEFLIAVILAPLVETFLFQYLIFLILDNLKISKKWVILTSALLFALTHNYSLLRIFHAFGGGILFGYTYWLCQLKYRYPFLVVLLMHASYNLYVFLIKHNYINSFL